jgi:hypothetical protein
MKHTMIAAVCAATLFAAASALADGCMIAPWQHEIYETGQIAYLDYDSDTSTERLHILPRFHGDTQNFAWIVPVPGLPELDESDILVFNQLSYLTAPEYIHREDGWGCTQEDYMVSPANDGDGGVDIIDSQLVGIYQAMILGADDAGALTDSLTTWGFLHDGNAADFTPLLDAYVQDDWYFVTLKVDSTAFDEAQQDWYWSGGMQPIALTFTCDAPTYPMRISAISAVDDTSVILYVNADRRMDFAGAETEYANNLSANEVRAIRTKYPDLGALLQPGDYLTKLKRSYSPAQMDADVLLEAAASNAEYRRIYYSGLPLTTGLLVLVFAAGLAWRSRRDGMLKARETESM